MDRLVETIEVDLVVGDHQQRRLGPGRVLPGKFDTADEAFDKASVHLDVQFRSSVPVASDPGHQQRQFGRGPGPQVDHPADTHRPLTVDPERHLPVCGVVLDADPHREISPVVGPGPPRVDQDVEILACQSLDLGCNRFRRHEHQHRHDHGDFGQPTRSGTPRSAVHPARSSGSSLAISATDSISTSTTWPVVQPSRRAE